MRATTGLWGILIFSAYLMQQTLEVLAFALTTAGTPLRRGASSSSAHPLAGHPARSSPITHHAFRAITGFDSR